MTRRCTSRAPAPHGDRLHEHRAVCGSGTSDPPDSFATPTPSQAALPQRLSSWCGGLRVDPRTIDTRGGPASESAAGQVVVGLLSVHRSTNGSASVRRVTWLCRYSGSRS